MRYRKITADGDYTFGQGLANFWVDVREAPAQAVRSRLLLLKGEWFADQSDGTAWSTRVLGRNTMSTYDPELQGRIAGTQKVTGIQQYESVVDPNTRRLTVRARISTAYGEIQVQETI